MTEPHPAGAERDLDARKARARAWFETLQTRLTAAFETLEDAGPAAPESAGEPGRVVRKRW